MAHLHLWHWFLLLLSAMSLSTPTYGFCSIFNSVLVISLFLQSSADLYSLSQCTLRTSCRRHVCVFCSIQASISVFCIYFLIATDLLALVCAVLNCVG
jgi:hypothetical protein